MLHKQLHMNFDDRYITVCIYKRWLRNNAFALSYNMLVIYIYIDIYIDIYINTTLIAIVFYVGLAHG